MAADCDSSLIQMGVVAEAIIAKIEVLRRVRVGDPIEVSWTKRIIGWRQMSLYLLVTTPARSASHQAFLR